MLQSRFVPRLALSVALAFGLIGRGALAQTGVQAMLPKAEYSALVDFYNATGGAGWLSSFSSPNGVLPANDGWLKPAAPFWNGVTITGVQYDANGKVSVPGHVQSINLANAILSGTLPASLGDLAGLTALTLQGNSLTGSIPSSLGNLTNLQYLWLSNNRLSGTIPSSLGGLPRLQSLDLHSNPDLGGSIPASLGGLTQLQGLLLQGDNLTGSIPAELGSLTNLQSLLLQGNQLSGTIPASLGGLYQLAALDLSNNQLSGAIPPSLGNLTNLFDLHLEYNNLSGQIPFLRVVYVSLAAQNLINLSANYFDVTTGSSNLAVINAMLAAPEQVIYLPQIPALPQIATQPQGAVVSVGTNTTLSVTAYGLPPLTYQWLIHGSVVAGQTNSSITITNFQAGNAGGYAVQISSPAGMVVSSNVLVMIPGLAAPVFGNPASSKTTTTLAVSTQQGVSYILESSDSLPAAGWSPVQTFVGAGSVMTLTDHSPAPGSRFYRVRVY